MYYYRNVYHRVSSCRCRLLSTREHSAASPMTKAVSASTDKQTTDVAEILVHEGHTYEKKCAATCNWVLWTCVEYGCVGQLATAMVRTKRLRSRRRLSVRRDVSGRLTAFELQRSHNHPAKTTAVARMTTNVNKPCAPPPSSVTETHEKLNGSNIKVEINNPINMNEPFKTNLKVSTQPMSFVNALEELNELKIKVENIDPINNDSLNDSLENSEQPMTIQNVSALEKLNESIIKVEIIDPINNNGIFKDNLESCEQPMTSVNDAQVSNIIDEVENSEFKPSLDLIISSSNDLSSEKKDFKDICETNVNVTENEDVSLIEYSMAQQNKIEMILQCRMCDHFFSIGNYNQHTKTVDHKSAYEKNFKDRIDFINYRVFSSSLNATLVEFFTSIENDFTILVDHLLFEHIAMIVNINFVGLYHENSSDADNKFIAEVKCFSVYNKILTKDTDVHKLYEDIMNSFSSQSDVFQNSGSGWSLEEILYIEIIITKKIIENDSVESKSPVISSCSNASNNFSDKTDNIQKTEPLQLLRCKQCSIYVVRTNYIEHLNSIAHQVTVRYFQNKKIQINAVQCEDKILSCRFLSPNHNHSVASFFNSIESDLLDLIIYVKQLQTDESIEVNLKVFAVYNQKNNLKRRPDNLGNVETLIMKNEILSDNTVLLHWFHKVSNTFEFHNKQYLKTMLKKSYYLNSVLFLDIIFYKVNTSEAESL